MSVTRVHEDPRVTKPYSDAQWQAIDALGEQVDRDLAAHDVRLTQGGEPTFVSIDDMEGPEWNYTALSPKKRELGEMLAQALARALRAGRLAALRAGQVVSRRAAAALGARHLLAHRRRAAVAARRAHRRHDEARHSDARRPRRRSASGWPRALGLPPSLLITAYEDVPQLLQARSGAAGQCRPAAGRPRQAGRARAPRAPAAARAWRRRRASCCRCKRRRRRGGRRRLDVEPVAVAARAAVCARRAIRRSACACRLARCRTCCRRSEEPRVRRRPVRAARRAAASATTLRAAAATRAAATSRAK